MDDDIIQMWTERELISNVSHQLRQSSSAASGFAELLATGTFGFADEKQKEVFQLLLRQVEHISEVNQWITIWVLSHREEE